MFIWSPGMTLDYVEKASIQQALKFYQNNKTTTARALGCAVNTLNAKIAQYEQEEKNEKVRAERERREREAFGHRQRGIQPPGTGFPTNNPEVTAAAIQDARLGEGLMEQTSVPSSAGSRVEPATVVPQEPALPLPAQREKVQEVLPRKTSGGSARRQGG